MRDSWIKFGKKEIALGTKGEKEAHQEEGRKAISEKKIMYT